MGLPTSNDKLAKRGNDHLDKIGRRDLRWITENDLLELAEVEEEEPGETQGAS